jgi:hypothetical protein
MNNTPDYDPKLSPERNAEIREWAAKNRATMALGRKIPDEKMEWRETTPNLYEVDEDAVSDEDEREIKLIRELAEKATSEASKKARGEE